MHPYHLKKTKLKNTTIEFTEKLKLRDSDICWLNDQWLYDVIDPYLREANKMADWNFDVDSFEDLQFTKYINALFCTFTVHQERNAYQPTNSMHGGLECG